MLIEFRVKNFRSFKEEQVFSMVASPDDSLPENLLSSPAFPKYKLLAIAVVYGANAAGKTNFIKALNFVEDFVSNSHKAKIGSKIKPDFFLFADTFSTLPTEFELTFIQESTRYRYGFILDTNKILEEWLYAYPSGRSQLWFERILSEQSQDAQSIKYVWDFGPSLKGENRRLAAQTRSNVLFLSKAADSNHVQLTQPFSWFNSCLDTFVNAQNLPLGLSLSVLQEKPGLQQRLSDLILASDLGISNVEINEKEFLTEDLPDDMPEPLRELLLGGKGWQINMFHRTNNPDINRPLSLEEESMGTQRLFSIGGFIFQALQEGRVLAIDELDASLHPILVKSIIKLFHDPDLNQKGAQLIFNTHDTTLLDTDFLRRDQIWLVEKDKGGASHLYPLSDFKVRKGEAIEKRYLEGRYGATPVLQGLLGRG